MTSCFEWEGYIDRHGYGHLGGGGSGQLAHRAAYEAANGPIPAGLVMDHLCRNRRCVNPEHLEAVTQSVNGQRQIRAMQTHCIHGHPFDERNTYWRPGTTNGRRSCRRCGLLATLRYQARKGIRA